jgi:putative PIN family toxin of toxin-antitoxin system
VTRDRVVLDTNVLISALLWSGPPHRILRAVEERRCILTLTPAILEEVRDALSRPKFAARIATLRSSVGELLTALIGVVDVIPDPPVERIVADDPDDDRILACAKAARARWVVSGDIHLLHLGSHEDRPILTPRQWLSRVMGKSGD